MSTGSDKQDLVGIEKKPETMKFLKTVSRFVKHIGFLASKIVAPVLYFEICWVYYSSKGVGLVVALITFSFALFNEELDVIRILCLLYVSYLIGVIITLKLLFRSKKVEDWVCREVGAEKVRSKLYANDQCIFNDLRSLPIGDGHNRR